VYTGAADTGAATNSVASKPETITVIADDFIFFRILIIIP
jgi:hypothetical protein